MTPVVVTTLLTANPDPQRGTHLEAEPVTFGTLAASLARVGVPLVVLADELTACDDALVVAVDADKANPYMARWRLIAEWLPDCAADLMFAVDATDVEMLHDPFGEMDTGVLYIGSEPHRVDFGWLLAEHPSTADFVAGYGDMPLLNPGVVGGDVVTVEAFLTDLLPRLELAELAGDVTDMGAVNELVWSTRWAERIVTGEQVHTVFRSYDHTGQSWWRHK